MKCQINLKHSFTSINSDLSVTISYLAAGHREPSMHTR